MISCQFHGRWHPKQPSPPPPILTLGDTQGRARAQPTIQKKQSPNIKIGGEGGGPRSILEYAFAEIGNTQMCQRWDSGYLETSFSLICPGDGPNQNITCLDKSQKADKYIRMYHYAAS